MYFGKDGPTEGDLYYPDSVLAAAFTVAELGEMLPAGTQSNRIGPLSHKPEKYGWRSWILDFRDSFYADTEADARAKLLARLVENVRVGA